MTAHSEHWIRTAYLSGATGPVAIGKALVSTGTRYVVATSANRATYGRAVCIAITAGDNDDTAIQAQYAGFVGATITGIADGTADDWVIVSATGALERKTTPVAGDDIIGRCPHTDGRMVLMPGVWDPDNASPGGGAAPGADTQVTFNDGGTPAGDAGLTYDKTANVLTVVGGVYSGSSPSTFGDWRFSNNQFLWWRGTGSNYQVLGLDSSGVIQLGGSSGADIEINASTAGYIGLTAQEIWADCNAIDLFTDTIDLASGVNVIGIGTATAVPSGGVAGKVIAYNQAGTLKYVQPDDTIISLKFPVQLGAHESGAVGRDSTATGNDSVAIGDDCHAPADYCWVGGQDCDVDASAFRSVVFGHTNVCNSPDGYIFGEQCSIGGSAFNSLCTYFASTVNAHFGCALGAYCTVESGANYASARGLAVTVTRPGQDAHGSGFTGCVGFNAIDLYRLCTAASAKLLMYDGNIFELDQRVYAMEVKITATKADYSVCAIEKRILLVKQVAGPTTTVVGSTTIANPGGDFASKGWSLTITAPGGRELAFTFNPGADTVHVLARVEWSHVYIP